MDILSGTVIELILIFVKNLKRLWQNIISNTEKVKQTIICLAKMLVLLCYLYYNCNCYRNECKNVFNSACGVKCNSGYALSGSSIR